MIGLHPDIALHILKEHGISAGGISFTKTTNAKEDGGVLRVVRVDRDNEGKATLVVASFPTFKDKENLPSSLSSWG